MTTFDRSFVPHLTRRELDLRPGFEWTPKPPAWAMIQVAHGMAYWIGAPRNEELGVGTVLLLTARASGLLRASCLGGVRLELFAIQPARLPGLLTLGEQHFFDAALTNPDFSLRIFPPESLLASCMKAECAGWREGEAVARLKLLQPFLTVFSQDLRSSSAAPNPPRNAAERLQDFLRKTPASDLLSASVAGLARMSGCTPRHLNRLFHELVGTSFRDKLTELRLARACELLASTEAKVVDVALESGYQSLSLFNSMFTRRFGISPGQWRQEERRTAARSSPERGRIRDRSRSLISSVPPGGASV